MEKPNVFHTGEIAVQIRAGERAIAERRETTIRDRLNDAANAFLESQSIVAVGALAPDGALWASMWCGAKGFVRGTAAGDTVEVRYDLEDHTTDPVRSIIRSGEPLGMLVIDLETRRRLRVNGVVGRVSASGLALRIREAFGNCPKYIQKRLPSEAANGGKRAIAAPERGTTLDDDRRSLIARSDTVFVASVHPERGIDASHRGGPPGFARVLDDRTLRIPDYPGNSMFQTLGNFEVDTRAALAFIDFERHRMLSMTGHAALDFDVDRPSHATGGTGRYWSFTVDRWMERSLSPSTTWTLVERSPFNPR